MKAPLRYAVLASGGGSNFQALLDRAIIGELRAEAVFVVSNNSQAPVLERARQNKIPAFHVSAKIEGSEEGVVNRLLSLLDEYKPELLVLAGYMKKVPDAVLKRMKNRVINIHPALLPEFGGAGMFGHLVHEAVVGAGREYSGMTIHMVNQHYDEGQVVLQRRVPIPRGTAAAEVGRMVLEIEHDSYWRVLEGFANGEIVPTGSDDPAEAVHISDSWKAKARGWAGTAFP